jgi:uncharacterized protein YjbJ (UPF0337 family)
MDRFDAEENASDAAGRAKEAVSSFAADAKGRAEEIARGAQDTYAHVRDRVSDAHRSSTSPCNISRWFRF